MTEIEIYTLSDFERFYRSKVSEIARKANAKFPAFVLTVKAIKDRVSRQQQKYIFGVLYPNIRQGLLDDGYETVQNLDADEFDYLMRQMFYYKTILTKKGEQKVPKRLSFGAGKKEDVCRYIDSLLRFGSQIGVYIEAPSDDWYIGFTG